MVCYLSFNFSALINENARFRIDGGERQVYHVPLAVQYRSNEGVKDGDGKEGSEMSEG